MTDVSADAAAPPPAPPRARATAGEARVAGAAAAAVALGVGELVTGLGASGQSLVGSVGNAFIGQSGGDLARAAIRLFQTNDKPALITGIVVISLLLGAGLGAASRRRPWIGPAGFTAFGVVGVLAAWRDPLASTLRAGIGATAAVLAASFTLRALLHLAARAHAPSPGPVPTEAATRSRPTPAVRDTPVTPYASRRAFFGWAAAAGAFGAVAAVAGKSARSTSVSDDARAAIRLPTPTNQPIPAAAPASMQGPGVASFDVPGLSPYLVPNGDFYRIDTAL
ncbi:MAG TPA: hypothetical protein VF320_04550, partial [Acidimicrobiales bacterium]